LDAPLHLNPFPHRHAPREASGGRPWVPRT
jgi:hypothetical protein